MESARLINVILTKTQTLKFIRKKLDESDYKQIPQLSSGLDIDLDEMVLVL
jgi:hypothetical protein